MDKAKDSFSSLNRFFSPTQAGRRKQYLCLKISLLILLFFTLSHILIQLAIYKTVDALPYLFFLEGLPKPYYSPFKSDDGNILIHSHLHTYHQKLIEKFQSILSPNKPLKSSHLHKYRKLPHGTFTLPIDNLAPLIHRCSLSHVFSIFGWVFLWNPACETMYTNRTQQKPSTR